MNNTGRLRSVPNVQSLLILVDTFNERRDRNTRQVPEIPQRDVQSRKRVGQAARPASNSVSYFELLNLEL